MESVYNGLLLTKIFGLNRQVTALDSAFTHTYGVFRWSCREVAILYIIIQVAIKTGYIMYQGMRKLQYNEVVPIIRYCHAAIPHNCYVEYSFLYAYIYMYSFSTIFKDYIECRGASLLGTSLNVFRFAKNKYNDLFINSWDTHI